MVGKGRNNAKRVGAGDIGGRDHRVNLPVAGGPSVKIAKGEIRQIMRAADGADKKRAIGPAVGAEPFACIDLGTAVKPLYRGADSRAGGQHRCRQLIGRHPSPRQ